MRWNESVQGRYGCSLSNTWWHCKSSSWLACHVHGLGSCTSRSATAASRVSTVSTSDGTTACAHATTSARRFCTDTNGVCGEPFHAQRSETRPGVQPHLEHREHVVQRHRRRHASQGEKLLALRSWAGSELFQLLRFGWAQLTQRLLGHCVAVALQPLRRLRGLHRRVPRSDERAAHKQAVDNVRPCSIACAA